MSLSPTAARPPWYREINATQWKSFLGAWIGYLLDGFDLLLITLVLTEISKEFSLTTVEAASLVSAAFISRWLGGALLGALGDRYGRKLAMITSITLYSVGTFACGLSWGYASIFTARLVIGVGMAGEYGASATYVLESWPARVRGRASGFLISGYYVGSVIAAQVYNWVVPAFGWRVLFYVGLAPVLIALWVRRSLPEAQEWDTDVAQQGAKPNPFRPLFATPRKAAVNSVTAVVASGSLLAAFTPLGTGLVPGLAPLVVASLGSFAVQLGGRKGWLLYLSMIGTVFVAFLYSWPILSLLPTYLKTELHYTASQVSDVVYFTGFGTMAGCWLAGFVGDWLGASKAYALTLLASLAFVFPVFAIRDNLLLMGALLFVLQGLSLGISGLLPRYVGGHFPTHSRGAGLGFTYNVGALGGAVAPVLCARLAQGMPLGTALSVLTFGLTLPAILLVGFDVPARLHRLISPESPRDHLAATGAEAGADTAPTTPPSDSGPHERPEPAQ
ncbi:sialate:H+ symport family MFS transporter [Streptomyces sp. NPDC059740]|uniref:sialate:H+ symport family MFS transporter n=1 Tax=Streptomyces sp. NPDC059740 TaxID=3346926 RepID=UPI00365CE78D